MNKVELVAQVAETLGKTKVEVKEITEEIVNVIVNTLTSGEDVAIAGLGTFKIKERAARMGRNPSTGEPLEIAASHSIGFQPAKSLKETVKGI